MTITPQIANTVKAIVKAHRNWLHAIVRGDDMESTIAIEDIKRALAAFRESCPFCGASMTVVQDHKHPGGKIITFRHCPECGTTVAILTPGYE